MVNIVVSVRTADADSALGRNAVGRSIQSRLKEKRPTRPSLQQAAAIKARPAAAVRGYDAVWQKLRAQHLAKYPACVTCGKEDKRNHVDHIVTHKGNDRLRLDPTNLQTLCHSHHSRKTIKNDGGFGKKGRTINDQ